MVKGSLRPSGGGMLLVTYCYWDSQSPYLPVVLGSLDVGETPVYWGRGRGGMSLPGVPLVVRLGCLNIIFPGSLSDPLPYTAA